MDAGKNRLKPEDLRPSIDLSSLEDGGEVPDLSFIHGRAVEALRMGLSIDNDRYNVFVVGPRFSGRDEVVEGVVKKLAKDRPTPPDWLYVYNFDDPSSPIAFSLPPDVGNRFVQDVDNFINTIRGAIRSAFESESIISEKEELVKEFNRRREEILSELNRKASELGFIIQPQPAGFNIIPIFNGEPLSPQKYASLPPDIKEFIDRKRKQLEEYIAETLKRLAKLDKELKERLEEFDRQVARRTVEVHFRELVEKYTDYPHVVEYLNKMYDDIIRNVNIFLLPPERIPQGPLDPFRKYRVNLIVDNKSTDGAPVVYEKNPTYYNLIGRIEKEMVFGALMTDFNNITAGSFHRANGGYLILDAFQLLKDPFAYDALKRVLKNRLILIEDIGERVSLFSTKTIKPRPIPFNGKVVLLGDAMVYYLLYYLDPEFPEIFGVKAELETDVPLDGRNLAFFYNYSLAFQKRENLKPFSKGAMEEILLEIQRRIEDRRKLSTNLEYLRELMLEASYYSEADEVRPEDVKKVLERRKRRDGRIEERIREMVERGFVLVDVEGSRRGVVNGLSVIELGGYAFGVPSRITASVGLGKPGIIDIERETGLGGRIHTKAVMIMGGYIYDTYGRDFPITLQVRITFEQNYSGVEGDSATAAELLAVLSEISGIPVKQGIAITGSMNQKGEIQPVGGINHKIEGFFYTCKAMGLSGEQGVIIPSKNKDNLILREEVVQAVRDGKFHIWAVDTIDDVIEIATGVASDEFHRKVYESLKLYYLKNKNRGGGKKDD